jgi:Aspartyl protease
MKSTITIVFSIFLFTINLSLAQQKIKLVKATSQKISIKDGNKPISKDWNWLGTNKKPTIFELEKNKQKRKVVFYTDIDSIVFDVESNKNYNFKVLLNSKDTCYARLTTVIPSYAKNCNGCKITSDTIPFLLGKDNNIHIKTKVNNSQDLDFIFDTGAGVVCLTAKGFKKSKIILDGNVENAGFGGTTTEKTSSSNKLEIDNLVWNNQSILCLDCSNENINENGFDGILGYNIFEDKVVEIDYDKSILIVHKNLPNTVTSFTKMETKENLFIKLNLSNTFKNSSGWFFFDTGSESNLIVENRFITNSNLFETMKILGKGKSKGTGGEIKNNIVLMPELNIGGIKLQSFPTVLLPQKNEDKFYKDGIIGNQILKRFNTIIDYPNLTVYLKPNSFLNDSFKKKKIIR